jgi:hypothetical protein
MVPAEDVDKAYAAGPVCRDYEYLDPTTVDDLVRRAMGLRRPRQVSMSPSWGGDPATTGLSAKG